MGRAEAYAAKNTVAASLYDGFIMGLGFSIVLVLLGAIREILGAGTLFADMQLLFGPIAQSWKIVIFSDYVGFLFAILPPGAFVGLGLLIAVKNWLDQSIDKRNRAKNNQPQKLDIQPLKNQA